MSDQLANQQFADYATAASILDTAELASLVRRIANTDPAGLSRREMMKTLEGIPVPEDFSRVVGEIQEAAEVVRSQATGGTGGGTPPR